MKFFFNKIIIISWISLLFISCSKDGGTANATANTSGQGGSLSKFTIAGNFLYAVDNHFLYSFDISSAANPVLTNTSTLNFDIETIYPYNNRLFIGTRTGLYIYSIDNPSTPVKIGEASHARSCDPVVANDSIAFVTLKGNSNCGPAVSGLYVHDIKNVLHPQLLKTIAIASPEGLGLKGSTLYVCCNNDGLKVFNIANPVNPMEIRTVTGADFKDVIPYGDILICYVSNGIMLYDIADPLNPHMLSLITN
ncbi:hypothetical protein BH11BAC4_BH11BAC4_20870 [soil metagenome]